MPLRSKQHSKNPSVAFSESEHLDPALEGNMLAGFGNNQDRESEYYEGHLTETGRISTEMGGINF